MAMTTWERFQRIFEHKEADRIPITDEPWFTTIRRWNQEGMPQDMDWCDYFDIDKVEHINIDISPRFPRKVLEENDRYIIYTSPWGVTIKEFKDSQSTPENLDYQVVDADSWEKAKARMTLEDDRIPWDLLKNNFDRWRAEGSWIRGNFWFGFDVTHARMMGTETTLIAMMEEPELVEDIFDTYLNRCEQLFTRIWDAGYHFDQMWWWDDMGYKGTTFFSPNLYRNLLKPYHTRAVKWAHDHGIFAELHSCGNVMTLVPDLLETGVDALNPLEVKAGMDSIKLKQEVGDKLVLHGGINAQQWPDTEAVIAEINEKIPVLKQNGGYIFSSDHSVPDDVSLENMKRIIEAAKKAGSY